MRFNKQKFFIALVCVCVGWIVGYQMGKSAAEKEFQNRYNQHGMQFNFPFGFFGSDPFENLEQRNDNQKSNGNSWWQNFLKPFEFFSNDNKSSKKEENKQNDPSWESVFSSGPELNIHEEDKFIIYEFSLSDVSKDTMSVKIENQQVIIEGSQKKETMGTFISSSFNRSYPTPEGVDLDNAHMDYIENKLVIKFPKQ